MICGISQWGSSEWALAALCGSGVALLGLVGWVCWEIWELDTWIKAHAKRRREDERND